MKISTKGQYALEAVLDIAIHASAGHENLKNIAERRNLSENYLEQIFAVLRRKGIVDSIRGAQGGYKLARKASEITAGDIIRAVEGPLSPVSCLEEERCGQSCGRIDTCVTRILWGKLMSEIDEAADSVSINDLVKCHTDMKQPNEIEYFI